MGIDCLGKESVIIGLSPACLRVGVRSGNRLVRVERTWLDETSLDAMSAGDFMQLDDPLKDLLRRVTHRPGPTADLVYCGQHALGEILSVGASGVGASGWRSAADLALRDYLVSQGSDLSHWTTDMQACSTFTNESGGVGTNVLVVGDRDDSLDKLAAWLRRCGCGIGRMFPTRGVLLAAGAGKAMELSSRTTDAQSAVMLLAEHFTVIAAGSAGAIKFVRCTDFGYSSLAEAIVRGVRSRGNVPPDGKGAFGISMASSRLMQRGLPKRGEVFDTDLNLRGEDLLPLIQPVLQRFVIETRQTMRFAFDQSAMMRTTLSIFGPGAGIPGFDSALSGQLELPVERVCDSQPHGTIDEESAGELLFVGETAGAGVVPPSESLRRRHRTLSGSMWTGAAAAAALVAGLSFHAESHRKRMESVLASHAPAIKRIEDHDEARQRAIVLADQVSAAQKVLGQAFGGRARWSAGLAEVSRLTGSEIQISELTGRMDSTGARGPMLNLKGIASSERGRPPSMDALGKFISRLSSSPLVDSVELLSSREDGFESEQRKSFELAVRLRTLGSLLPRAISLAHEGEP